MCVARHPRHTDSICGMMELKRLDGNGCSIATIPHDIGYMTNLSLLDLRKNQLTHGSFPESFRGLQNLQRLYLRCVHDGESMDGVATMSY